MIFDLMIYSHGMMYWECGKIDEICINVYILGGWACVYARKVVSLRLILQNRHSKHRVGSKCAGVYTAPLNKRATCTSALPRN